MFYEGLKSGAFCYLGSKNTSIIMIKTPNALSQTDTFTIADEYYANFVHHLQTKANQGLEHGGRIIFANTRGIDPIDRMNVGDQFLIVRI
jgi:hypothetical protein